MTTKAAYKSRKIIICYVLCKVLCMLMVTYKYLIMIKIQLVEAVLQLPTIFSAASGLKSLDVAFNTSVFVPLYVQLSHIFVDNCINGNSKFGSIIFICLQYGSESYLQVHHVKLHHTCIWFSEADFSDTNLSWYKIRIELVVSFPSQIHYVRNFVLGY